jgi:hypothetical protein
LEVLSCIGASCLSPCPCAQRTRGRRATTYCV